MPVLKLNLCKKTEPKLNSIFNPVQHELFNEVLTFDGGEAFASEDQLVVKKEDVEPCCHPFHAIKALALPVCRNERRESPTSMYVYNSPFDL